MKIVPDANLVVALVISLPYSEAATRKMREWQEQNAELLVPTLWSYEVVSALRKAIASSSISAETAVANLQDILSIGIQEVPPTIALHQLALEWAERVNQIVAYDGAYLALAESVKAEFWTADKRLATAARNSGVSWIHLLDES
jgi:predicted nucleic acid-binding protein